MEALLLHDQALDLIWKLGLERRPIEACGILLPEPHRGRWLIEMPNRSPTPQNMWMFNLDDLKVGLEGVDTDLEKLTIFHTHPGGNVGPSKTDLRAKIESLYYLVVALTDEGPVPTWY